MYIATRRARLESREAGFLVCYKGQLISKANCQAVNSSKKRTNEFILTSSRVFWSFFWKRLNTPKSHFEII